MTDVLALRALLLCGYTGLVAFHSLHERPLRIPLRWSLFFILVNGGMALSLVRDRYPGAFDAEQVRAHVSLCRAASMRTTTSEPPKRAPTSAPRARADWSHARSAAPPPGSTAIWNWRGGLLAAGEPLGVEGVLSR